MFRTSDMVLIAVMVAAAAVTYKTKQGAEEQLEAVHKIERQIRFEQDSIDLLKADWSLLTQPARLQRLSEAYQADLQLQPVDARQFAKLDEVPIRNLDIQDIIGQAMGLAAVAKEKPVEDLPKVAVEAKPKSKKSATDSNAKKVATSATPAKAKKPAAKPVVEEPEDTDETTTGAVDE